MGDGRLRLASLLAHQSPLEVGWHGDGQRGDPGLCVFRAILVDRWRLVRHLLNQRGCGLRPGHSGQVLGRLLSDDSSSFAAVKACHENEVTAWPTDLVPRDPDAIRVAQTRLAVMLGQLVRGNDEFFQGGSLIGTLRFAIEDVNGDTSIHCNRFCLALFVEVQSAAESSHARLTGLVQDGVSPDREHPFGHGCPRSAEPVLIPTGR